MEINDFQELALLTESPVSEAMVERVSNPQVLRMLHAAMGIATEAGETLDILKRHIFYGQPLDEDKITNFVEELGDTFWYIALGGDAVDKRLEAILFKNIAKLRARYPDKFNENDALNRDLDNEKRVLEGDGYRLS